MNSLYKPSLKNLKEDSVERFTLKGEERYAKVVSVYDGDTLDLAFYQDDEVDNPIRYKCRMLGYDAPELDEINGELTRNYLAHLCTGGVAMKPADFRDQNGTLTKDDLQKKLNKSKRLIYAEFEREGKYGRPVVTLYQTSPRGNPPRVRNKEEEDSINTMITEFVNELDKESNSESE